MMPFDEFKITKEELLEAAKEAAIEHEKGETVVLSSPEEIKTYFLQMLQDEPTFMHHTQP